MDATDVIAKCGVLSSNWSKRNQKIKQWYQILRLKDELKQEGMESVVANDPKTGYLLGKHLLTSSVISHKIETEELKPEEITSTSYLEGFMHKRWQFEEERYRRAGRQRFTSKLVGFLLATGWYSVFSMVDKDRIRTEIWNPTEVFPEYDLDGLVEVAHVYPLTLSQAHRKAKAHEWDISQGLSGDSKLYDYWGFDNDGDLVNSIVLGTQFVKKPVKEDAINKLIQKLGEPIFPIFISPVGGLPDEGTIIKGKDWQENFGEAIVATNEGMTLNYNKMLSFIQQTSRNAAQARWYEKSTGDTPILTEENIDKYGAIFRMGLQEDVGFIQPPAIPVELRTAMFEYSNMIQRGSFPWVLHGNLQQQLSYLAMANVASSALQQLTPYLEGLEGVLSDINNFWYNMMDLNGYRPYGYKKPQNLPEDFRFRTTCEIQIPGYLVQRASVARMLNPNFRLPQRWIMDRMFPEIKDSIRTQAQVREEDAMMHPKAVMVDAIIAYREHSKRLRDAGDIDSAKLYEKLAGSMEAELMPQQQPGQRAQAAPPGINREVMPQEMTEPLTGLGEI